MSTISGITPERREKIKRVLEKKQPTLTIVLENVHDPHNVSAVLRSCDAVGIVEVCLVYHDDQELPDLGRRSSASAWKWIDLRSFETVRECFDALHLEGKSIYTTHLSEDALSLYHLNLTRPVALVFGNEHSGVSEEALALADGNFLIPQVGMIHSLNISVACAVSLFEAFRQRMEAGMYRVPQLGDPELKELMEDWVKR